eukprot:1369058-Amorphochlora_amoeboformis.AAC.1
MRGGRARSEGDGVGVGERRSEWFLEKDRVIHNVNIKNTIQIPLNLVESGPAFPFVYDPEADEV